MRWQSLLCGVEARSFASLGDGPLGAAPERKRTRGTRLQASKASPGSNRSLATAQRKSGKLIFSKRDNPAPRASAGGQHATRVDAREFAPVLQDLPQTGLERIEFALRPPRNSPAFVDPERDKQHPKGDHYDPESRYQQDDWQQGCGD